MWAGLQQHVIPKSCYMNTPFTKENESIIQTTVVLALLNTVQST